MEEQKLKSRRENLERRQGMFAEPGPRRTRGMSARGSDASSRYIHTDHKNRGLTSGQVSYSKSKTGKPPRKNRPKTANRRQTYDIQQVQQQQPNAYYNQNYPA